MLKKIFGLHVFAGLIFIFLNWFDLLVIIIFWQTLKKCKVFPPSPSDKVYSILFFPPSVDDADRNMVDRSGQKEEEEEEEEKIRKVNLGVENREE